MPDDLRVRQALDETSDPHATSDYVGDSSIEWRPACRAGDGPVASTRPTPEPCTSLATVPASDAPLPVVPGYAVEAVLGVGGMGVVFRARHLRLNRVVALKMALAGAYAGAHERERFRREAEAVAALRHPNVVQVYDVGDAAGRPYFTMEFVEGGTLAQKLAGSPLPAREAAALVATLAGAVEAAHRAGIVHRDLKPANVLLTADGAPKVSDFGLARRLGGEAGLTHTGTAVGTPSYMAPEQARGEAAGPAADVYALAAILYELLTGRPPFRAETGAETVRQLLTQDPVPPSRLNGQVARDLETVCTTGLHKEASCRYPTAAGLADDLGRFLRGEAIAARREGGLRRLARWVRRRPVLSAAVAVATASTLALLGGGAWTLSERAAAVRAADAERAATEQAVDDDLKEAVAALGQSAWPVARTALERARGRLGDRGTAGLRLRLGRAGDDLQLGERLEAIRLNSAHDLAGLSLGRCDSEYEEAFGRADLGRPHDDPHVVAGRVRATSISTGLLAALDHWSSVVGEPRKGWLLEVARRADRDPTGWRDQARDPAVRADAAAFVRLIETAPVADQPVSLLLALDRHLPHRSKARVAFLERVQRAHAGDLWANITLGFVLTLEGRAGEAARYYQAAVSLRPRQALGYHHLGFALFVAGRMEDAVEPFRQAVDLDPTSVPAVQMLAFILTRLGRHTECIDRLTAATHANPKEAGLHTFLGRSLEAQNRPADALARHRQAVALDPSDAAARKELRNVLIRQNQFDEVRATWQAAIGAQPHDHGARYGYAEFCLFSGDEGEYRRACRALLAAYGATTDPHVAERTGRACLLLPAEGSELARAVALVERAATRPDARPSFLFARGLAEYRQGQFDRAIVTLRGDGGRALGASGLVLAMALHRSGQRAEARTVLAMAVPAHDWRPSGVHDQDGWIAHVLRREAERLILPNLPTFLDGKYQPRGNDERLAFLGACQFTNRPFASARLYAAAFVADPLFAEDFRTGHRANAARAAALAGCGRGNDATGLGETERAKWRAQAREWLRADLAAWGKSRDAARDAARQKLSGWRADADLAGLFDPAQYEKLPSEERTDCLALWDEVRAAVADK